MMMFLLGVLITWIILSFVYGISDCLDRQDIGDVVVGLPFYLTDYIITSIVNTYRVVKVLDLCIKYHIPIFKSLTLTTIKEKLDNKGKEKWVKRMPKNQQKKWRKALDM